MISGDKTDDTTEIADGMPMQELDYVSSLPADILILAYDKNAATPIEKWINESAADIEEQGINVETPVLTRTEYHTDLATCQRENNGSPCGGATCNMVASNATTIQYWCGRWGSQYFLTNKAGSRVIVVENFGSDPPLTAAQVLAAVSFK